MVRSTFSEEIKKEAMTIEELVEMDFENTLDFEEPMYYNRYREPRYDSWDGVLYDVSLKDILDDDIPDWVYNDEYTEEEQEQLNKLHDDLFSNFIDEYVCKWDAKVEDFYKNKEKEAEEELGNDERWEEYQEEKAVYEASRDSYYGWCMNGGGGRRAFRSMYGDGNFYSYGEWLLNKYGE